MRHFLFLLTLFPALFCTAQHPVFRQLTDENGLPSNEVYDLFQDNHGVLWMGTDNGLCRYDGYQFQRFSSPLQAGRAMTDIQQDRQGRIWCHNFSGQIFSLGNGQMHLLEAPRPKTAFPLFLVDSLRDELFAIHRDSGLFIYDLTRKTHRIWFPERTKGQSLPEGEVMALAALAPGKIGFTTIHADFGILEGDHYQRIKVPAHFLTPSGPDGRKVAPFCIPFSIGSRTFFYEKLTDRLLEVRGSLLEVAREHFFAGLGLGAYATIQPFGGEKAWLCSFKGALCIDAQLEPVPDMPRLFPDWAISDVMTDREGNLWVSTLKNGVCFLPATRLTLSTRENAGLPFSSVTAIQAYTANTLLLGFANGTGCIWDVAQGKSLKTLTLPTSNSVSGFGVGQDGTLLVNNTGLHLFDASGRRKEVIFHATRNFHVAAGGDLFVAGGGSSLLIPRAEAGLRAWAAYPLYTDQGRSVVCFREARCNDIWYDGPRKTVWAMYTDELMLHHQNGTTDTVRFNGHAVYGTSLAFTGDGAVVACGTVSDGVLLIRDGKVIRQLSVNQGLPAASIRRVKVQGTHLWILHESGISCYDLDTQALRHYTANDGIYERDLYDLAELHGKVWVGTARGLLSFPIDLPDVNTVAPPVFIQHLSAGDSPLPLTGVPEIVPSAGDIRVGFYGLSFRSRQDFRYRYRLLGLGDTTWTTVGREVTELHFPALAPGTYTFEVKAVNEDGIASLAAAAVSFAVLPPFWQTWWFRLMVILLICMVLVAGMALRLRLQQRRNSLALDKARVETALRNSQLSSLKVQMNPHFIFNALNSIQDFMMSNEKKQANLYLGKFSDLMRMTLDMSQQDSVAFSDELKVLHIYLDLESLRFSDSLEWSIAVDPAIDPEEVQIPSMLIQPYVENALKHGLLHKKTDKKLSIRFHLNPKGDALVCEIEDNGVGRAKSEALKQFRPRKHTSFAASATQKRLELLNHGREKAIAVQYTDKVNARGEPEGTVVVLEVPILPVS